MCFSIFKRYTNFNSKYIYWDTNCYRLLGRQANAKGVVWLDAFLNKLKKAEDKRGVTVKVSYLVLTEMFAHLDDAIDSNTYLECKHGLYAALWHSGFDSSSLLPNSENTFIEHITGKIPAAELHAQESLYNAILELNNHVFSDAYIGENKPTIQTARNFLSDLKSAWRESFAIHFIRKHDVNYTGNWQLFAGNKDKRNELLKELRKAKASGEIYSEFGVGMYLFVSLNAPGVSIPNMSNELLEQIVDRFRPLFSLQYRIIELMCQTGYNLDKYINDITDFLIVANLHRGRSIFISNETRKLVPNLRSQGYKDDVWTFDQYLSSISISL